MTFMLVNLGAQAAVSMPAGFERVEAMPNEPAELKVSSKPDRILSYATPKPARTVVWPPSPKRLLNKPLLALGDQASATRGAKS
jgi:hypothetical protein